MNAGMTLYAIQAGEREEIKIGKTYNQKQRIGLLQTGQSETLHVVAELPDGGTLEEPVQRLLTPFHIRGEWYRISPDFCASLFDKLMDAQFSSNVLIFMTMPRAVRDAIFNEYGFDDVLQMTESGMLADLIGFTSEKLRASGEVSEDDLKPERATRDTHSRRRIAKDEVLRFRISREEADELHSLAMDDGFDSFSAWIVSLLRKRVKEVKNGSPPPR